MSYELPVNLRTSMANETCLGVRTRPFLQQNRMFWQMDKTLAYFEPPSLISSLVKFSSPVTIQDTRLKSIVGIIDAAYSFEMVMAYFPSTEIAVEGVYLINMHCALDCSILGTTLPL